MNIPHTSYYGDPVGPWEGSERTNILVGAVLEGLQPPQVQVDTVGVTPTMLEEHDPYYALYPFSRGSRLCLDNHVTRPSIFPVASGGFADVWEGYLEDRKVSIKTLRLYSSSGSRLEERTLLRRLWREYLALSSLSHQHILTCLGYTYDFSPSQYMVPSLISPWMENGTVNQYIKNYPETNLWKLLSQIAEGLCYLHSHTPTIVHGDIRAGNILVSEHGVPCLCDFGLSRVLEEARGLTTSSQIAGAVRWMAPVLFRAEASVSVHSDVWAYGMTLLELMSGERPYAEVKFDLHVIGEIREGNTPCPPVDRHGQLKLSIQGWNTCLECWRLNPTQRPSMSEVHAMVLDADISKITEGSTGNDTKTSVTEMEHDLETSIQVNLVGNISTPVKISCIRFSPKGDWVAMTDGDTVEVYDTSSFQLIKMILSLPKSVMLCLSFAPYVNVIATGSEHGSITIQNLNSPLPEFPSLQAEFLEICSIDFSPTNDLIVVSRSRGGPIRVWDRSRRDSRKLGGNSFNHAAATSVAFSPCGDLIATGLNNGLIYIWDVGTCSLIECLLDAPMSINYLAFTPDGEGIISGRLDGIIQVWDILPFLQHSERDTPVSPFVLQGTSQADSAKGCTSQVNFKDHEHDVSFVAVSEDNKWTVSSSRDGLICFWDHSSGRSLRYFRSDGWMPCLALSSHGGMMAIQGSDLCVKLYKCTTYTVDIGINHRKFNTSTATRGWIVRGKR